MDQHNFLLIGLGGTGGAVVRELKKKLYTEWRSVGNTGSYPEVYDFENLGSKIATLSIDSNAKDLGGEGQKDGAWQIFGKTLALGDREKVLIDPSGANKILSSIDNYPGIEPWIKQDMPFVREMMRGSGKAEGCNQIRRMGRLALASGNSLNNFEQRLSDRIKALRSGGTVNVEIHIACSLAAGTGSGSVVDVLAQLQRFQKINSYDFPVYIHGLVTSREVGSVNTGNFYANQYAALTELNAFRLAIYRPWDIRAKDAPSRLEVPEDSKTGTQLAGTFKSVALVTDTTEGNLDVPFEDQIDNVAELIFQLSVRQVGNVPKELRDAFSSEDRVQETADVSGGNRSTAFIGYGIQRVIIPEHEIREKLSYSFGKQFVLKLLYDNWDNYFHATPRRFSKEGFVDERRGIWKITKEHLYLDLVEDATGQPKYKTYEMEWREALTKQGQRTQEMGDDYDQRKGWLADFDQRANNYWEQGFRARAHAGGVVDYFNNQKETVELKNRARAVRSFLEQDLLKNVERGTAEYPVHHLPSAVDFLKQRIEADRLWYGEIEAKAIKEVKASDAGRSEVRQQYQRAGRFAKGKHERLFGNYRDLSIRLYYWRTIQLAAEYGQAFCERLIDEFEELHRQIDQFSTRLKLINSNFDAEMDRLINEADVSSGRTEIDYLVDAKMVNNTIKNHFEGDKNIQAKQIVNTIEALQKLRGDRMEFAAYLDQMAVDDTERVSGDFVEELRSASEQNAIEADRKLRESENQFEGIFSQNILYKLFKDYGQNVDGSLEDWLRQLINKSMPMVSFDPNEEPMDVPEPGPILRRCVFVPNCRDVSDQFKQQFEQKVQSILGGGGSCRHVETLFKWVPEEVNKNEIVVISVAFFFSARFARVTHGLKAKYLERLKNRDQEGGQRAFFQVHTESHNPMLPDLMKLERKETLSNQLGIVLLATALELMHIETGHGEVSFGTKDTYGQLGEDSVDSGMRVNEECREIQQKSPERFKQPISLEAVVLYKLYLDQFKENALPKLRGLVAGQFRQERDIEAIVEEINRLRGEAFVLSGGKQNHPNTLMFRAQATQAIEQARRLADRSSA